MNVLSNITFDLICVINFICAKNVESFVGAEISIS